MTLSPTSTPHPTTETKYIPIFTLPTEQGQFGEKLGPSVDSNIDRALKNEGN